MAEGKSPENGAASVPTPQFYQNKNTCWSTKKRRTPSDETPNMSRVLRSPVRLNTSSRQDIGTRYSRMPLLVSFAKDKRHRSLPMNYYDPQKPGCYFDQCFQQQRLIGEGCFGQVFATTYLEDGLQYAVKVSLGRFRGLADRTQKCREVQKLEKLRGHPNIVRYIQAWEQTGYLYIQSELCVQSLEQYLLFNRDLPEQKIWEFTVDLLNGVKHIHDKHFIHLDLKPANILMSSEEILKVGDFGLMVEDNAEVEEAVEGDSKYLPMEALDGVLGTFTDIFSVGLTLLELAADLDLPNEGLIWNRLREGILPIELLQSISDEFVKLIHSMMNPAYMARPSAEEILCMPILQDIVRQRTFYVNFCDKLYQTKRQVAGAYTRTKGFLRRVVVRRKRSSSADGTSGVESSAVIKVARPSSSDTMLMNDGTSAIDPATQSGSSSMAVSNGTALPIMTTPIRTPRYLPQGLSPYELNPVDSAKRGALTSVLQRKKHAAGVVSFARKLNLSAD